MKASTVLDLIKMVQHSVYQENSEVKEVEVSYPKGLVSIEGIPKGIPKEIQINIKFK